MACRPQDWHALFNGFPLSVTAVSYLKPQAQRIGFSAGGDPARHFPTSPPFQRKRLISAVLVVVASAGEMSETCKIPTDNEFQARTAKCLVSIDGRVLVNERCNISVAANGGIALEFGKYYVDVRPLNASRRSGVATASWNGGNGGNYPLTSLGLVTAFQRNGAQCVRNRRLEMCYSDLLTCKCGPGEAYGCKPGDGE